METLQVFSKEEVDSLRGIEAEPPPKPPTLAELAAALVAELEAGEGEVTAHFEALDAAVDDKVLGYKRYNMHLESKRRGYLAEAEPFQEIADALKKKAATIEKAQNSLQARLLGAMKLTGKTRVETAIGSVWVQYSDKMKVAATWVDTAAEEFVQTTKAPKLAVLAALFRDKVKALTPPKATDAQKAAARAEALKSMPEGVTVETGETLRGL